MGHHHIMRRQALVSITLACVTGCASGPAPTPTNLALGDPGRRGQPLDLAPQVILESRTGQRLDVDALAERLDGKRLVIFGETHAQPPVQAAERQLLDALARRGRRVMVGLEMLPASVQPALDRWVAGEGSEVELIRASHWYRHWGFHFGHYRALFEFARAHRTPLVALNVEREVISSVRRVGFEGLAPVDRAKLPDKVDLASEEHRLLFGAFMGGAHGGMTASDLEAMFRAQCTWDAVMAHNAGRALAADPDPRAVMVVMAGFGHVVYDLGIRRQAGAAGLAGASVVALAAVDDDGRPEVARASVADFVWGMPAKTSDATFPSLGASLSDKPGVTGATVTTVRPGSVAEKAGLAAGDVLTAVDGEATPDKESVLIRLGEKAWGDSLALEVVRSGQRHRLTAVLRREAPAPAVPPA